MEEKAHSIYSVFLMVTWFLDSLTEKTKVSLYEREWRDKAWGFTTQLVLYQ